MRTNMSATELSTYTGKTLDLLAPSPASICLADISMGLSQINRYGGQAPVSITVAEHSYIVAEIAVRQRKHAWALRQCGRPTQHQWRALWLAGLLHDAHEAYIGDWISPLKRTLDVLDAPHAVGARAKIVRSLDAAVACAFQRRAPCVLHANSFHTSDIKDADSDAQRAEAVLWCEWDISSWRFSAQEKSSGGLFGVPNNVRNYMAQHLPLSSFFARTLFSAAVEWALSDDVCGPGEAPLPREFLGIRGVPRNKPHPDGP